MGHCWIIAPTQLFRDRFSCFKVVFYHHRVNITSRDDAITRILCFKVGCTHASYMHFPAFEYKEDVKEWDHSGKRRGNAINCRLSNCNYAVSPGLCLHVGVSLQNKGNWATAHSMNAPVMSNRLFKQIAKLLVIYWTIQYYSKLHVFIYEYFF